MSDAPDSKLAWIDAYLAHLRGVRQLSPHTTAAYARDLQELAALHGRTPFGDGRHAGACAGAAPARTAGAGHGGMISGTCRSAGIVERWRA